MDFKNKKLILQIHRKLAKSDISDFLISRCAQKGILTAKILDSGLCFGKKYVLTNFIDSKHIYNPGDREITQIIDLVIKTPSSIHNKVTGAQYTTKQIIIITMLKK